MPLRWLLLVSIAAVSILPSIAKPRPRVKEWHFIGPWIVGKNELDGDPAEVYGGISRIFAERKNNQVLFSEMAVNGKLAWSKHSPDNRGNVLISPRVDWNSLVQGLNSVEVQEWQGWAVGVFTAPKGTYNINCNGIRTYFVDSSGPLAGDMFSSGRMWNSISLTRPGEHTIFVRLKAKGHTQFLCNIQAYKAKKPFQVYSPPFLPDFLGQPGRGYSMMGQYISVPVVNLGDSWLNVSMQIRASQAGMQFSIPSSQKEAIHSVAPGQLTSLQLAIKTIVPSISIENCQLLRVGITVSSNEYTSPPIDIEFRCRNFGESFVFTFVDHDGTVSRAAAITPLASSVWGNTSCANGAKSKGTHCPVVLSLHGTGVDVSMQADSYKFKPRGALESEKYTFGVNNAWLLAPTRHGAHNWEYTGHLSAMSALLNLPELIHSTYGDILPGVDTSRVLYTGHSMGGHGAWTLASHDTDRAIGIVVAAGWIRKEEYGDSNRFFLHDIGHAHVDPGLKSILESSFSEYNADIFTGNLRSVPVVIRVGANDRAVPPWYSRKMSRLLREHGVDVIYDEVKDKAHWWWDTGFPNDGGVLNDPKMRQYYSSMIKDGNQQLKSLAKTFTFAATNPAGSTGRGGFRILQQIFPYRLSEVSVNIGSQTINVLTSNVKRLRLNLKYLMQGYTISHEENMSITFDYHFQLPLARESIDYCKVLSDESETVDADIATDGTVEANFDGWEVCRSSPQIYARLERAPTTYGPSRQVATSPFEIVVGGKSDRLWTDIAREGGLYIGNTHYTSTDTMVSIVKDDTYNFGNHSQIKNLILIGGPEENEVTKRFLAYIQERALPHPPITFEEYMTKGQRPFRVGNCRFTDSGYGVLYTSPLWVGNATNGRNALVMIIAATDTSGLRNILRLAEPTIPPMMRAPFANQVPDYVVVGPGTKSKGVGGIISAGYWDNQWNLHFESSYGVDDC